MAGASDEVEFNAGVLDVDGTFNFSGGAFNFNGGTVAGTPNLFNADLTIGPSSTGAASFSMQLGSTISGNISADQTIHIDGVTSHATLTAHDSFFNHGTILLESTVNNWNATLVIDSPAVLTNGPSGQITVNNGAGGARLIQGGLVNNGTVNINTSTTLAIDSSGDEVTNNHIFTVASGATLTMSNANAVFNQNGGTLDPGTTTFSLTGGAFNYQGGSINGTIKLHNADLLLNAGASGNGAYVFTGSSNTITGDITANQTVQVNGTSSGPGILTATSSFSNAGSLTLETLTGTWHTYLIIDSPAILTNSSTGVINVEPG